MQGTGPGSGDAAIDLLAAAVVLVFALVHVFGGRLRFLHRTPRSVWLSVGSGVSVAYVFLHLIPELGRSQALVERTVGAQAFLQHHVYLLALAGMTVFYGLERLACRSREGGRADDPTEAGTFAVHIGSFAVYNFIIGLLLVRREESSSSGLMLYALALGLHFLVNDHGLRRHHQARYDHFGRWLLAGAVAAGWGAGLLLQVQPLWLQLALALLAGGIIMNVLKEELPGERESRFSAFLAGTVAYGALLLMVG